MACISESHGNLGLFLKIIFILITFNISVGIIYYSTCLSLPFSV